MVGDVHLSDGVEFEVVWDGGEGLIPPRDTKNIGFWTAPKRLYNKKAEYWSNLKKEKDEYEESILTEVVVCDGNQDTDMEPFSLGGEQDEGDGHS